MSYIIRDIKDTPVDSYPFYFCDANVWISAMKSYCAGHVESYESPYQEFVEKIVALNEEIDETALAKIRFKPKIIITSLVISEIVNTYMRNVAMRAYFGPDYWKYEFKKEYREDPRTDYNQQLVNLCSDIAAFSDYVVAQSDSFSSSMFISLLTDLPKMSTDLNDLYYSKLFKNSEIPIVTHDRDFKFDNVVIITANNALLRLSKRK